MKINLNSYKYNNFHDFKNGFCKVLKLIIFLFNKYIGFIDCDKLSIVFEYTDQSPRCQRDTKTIYLNVDVSFYCQVAYQFCHELCHYIIPYDVPQNLRWFEESICECASLFFMKELSNEWRKQDFVPNYADAFISYIENAKKRYTYFDLHQLNDNDSSILRYLSKNEYNRPLNLYVAIQLLSVFENNPFLWKDINKLCYLTPNLSLSDSLLEWAKISSTISSEVIGSFLDLIE